MLVVINFVYSGKQMKAPKQIERVNKAFEQGAMK
jgi:hypothetical protein